MSDYESLRIERRAAVAEITLARPEVENRFDDAGQVELTRALGELGRDGATRVVVLASTGPVFSAGGDLDGLLACQAQPEERLKVVENGRRLLATLIELPQPLIVALHGDAVALGATVALSADAIVAARGAHLSDPHVRIGLVAGDGGCLVWPQSAGILRAKRYLLTGDRLGAEDAYRMGLVTDLVDDPAEVGPAARAMADRIAALPPLAVQGTKRALNRLVAQRAGEVVELAFAHELTSLASADLVEAVAALRERRRPAYRGV